MFVFAHLGPNGVIAWTEEERGFTSPCWIWQRSMSHSGYGRYRGHQAHRVSYEAAKGPIPDGFVTDHLCRVRPCVNPAHLEAVDDWENQRRGAVSHPELRAHLPWKRPNRWAERAAAVEAGLPVPKWTQSYSPRRCRRKLAWQRRQEQIADGRRPRPIPRSAESFVRCMQIARIAWDDANLCEVSL